MWLAQDFQFLVLQHKIDILFYSYSCICFNSIHGIRRSVSFNLCEFFHTCLQDWWFFICCPLLRILSRSFFSFKGLSLWLVTSVCVYEEKLFFSDIRRRGGHLDRCCLDIFPDFGTYLLRDFKFKSGEKISCSVDWSSNVCYLEIKLQHIVTSIPECWWDCVCLEKTGDGLVVCQDNCWLCCLPQNVCKLKKCHTDCQKFFWVYGHFKLCRGESFWAKCHGGIRFPLWLYFLIGIVFNH